MILEVELKLINKKKHENIWLYQKLFITLQRNKKINV